MADILIKNMEMPKRCLDCRFCDDNGDYPLCIITETQKGYTFIEKDIRMDDCPLVELPCSSSYEMCDKYREASE